MNYKYFYVLFLVLLLLSSCQETDSEHQQKILSSSTSTLFKDKSPAASGLNFSNDLTPTTSKNILEYLYYYNGGGVGIGDINQDGLEDVLLTANESGDKLFLNKGNLQFEDITQKSGIAELTSWSTGVTIDDVNKDGWLDIYICKVAPLSENGTHNLLYLNKGDGTFEEVAEKYGLAFAGYSTQASFFDYDMDGDLDMYLLNQSVHSVRSYGKIEKRKQRDDLSGDRLFENQLNESVGKFVDVTSSAGIYSSALGYGLALITTDINKDGLPDIYVGNDFHENDYIYLNNGNKTFTESMASLLNHSTKFTMGVDVADMNNDGNLDIFTTDMLPYQEAVALQSGGEDTDQVFNIRKELGFEDQYARNHFQLQNTNATFSDIALMTNTYATDWSWSVLLQDFDNNGQADIFITNGIVKRPNDLDYINFINQMGNNPKEQLTTEELELFLAKMPAQKLKNILFLQKGDLQFSDISAAEIGTPTFSNGAAYADLDKDGDLDIIANNINQSVSLLENTGLATNNFIAFELKGTGKQTLKGTVVEVVSGAKRQQKQYTTTRGYQSSSTHYIHFGLGEQEDIDSVRIIWPDKTEQLLINPTINQYHTIVEKGNATYNYPKQTPRIASLSVLPFRHLENKFEDYNADKLIPELLSREGPAVVYADFNQDGKKDLFLGGARYQIPTLLIQQEKGFSKQAELTDFKIDAKYEDVAAAAIDFDKDGDLDLYVVSGGNDEKELNKNLEDRIYLNDGKGNLKRLPLSLPHTNGSTVAVGDFDKDGFDDLFIGARSIPASYGLSPYSFVLKNKGGFGVEIALKERFGMITHSEWADIDSDDDLDLVFCGDWMNIGVLENQGNGKLVDQSKALGLTKSAGLWNTFYLKDINQDGQLDILAGNAGLNFKWKATVEKPIKLYVLDMDGNGQSDPIIFHHYFNKYMPFAPLTQLMSQVPAVRKQFVSFQKYTTVQDIEDFKQVNPEEIVERKQLNELRSMIYLSENGKYVGVPLPKEAQMSSIQGLIVNEHGELLFVGNCQEYLTELGQSTANSGGIYTEFDLENQLFKNYQSLSLPPKLNTRGITPIGEKEYLITCNNSVQYILKR